MEKLKIENNDRGDSYNIEDSFLNEDNFCVHVPVVMGKKQNTPDVNIDFAHRIGLELKDKYPDLRFTSEWKTISDKDGIKEYLFIYEK